VDRFAALLKQYADRRALRDMGERAREKIAAYSPQAAAGRLVEAVNRTLMRRESQG
jgi:hypothetical protein